MKKLTGTKKTQTDVKKKKERIVTKYRNTTPPQIKNGTKR